ncbi:APC family permease [Ktedonosporobacter rubrisoli]|nr:APC family permease [Ktedonosporobacter rubrisoli]
MESSASPRKPILPGMRILPSELYTAKALPMFLGKYDMTATYIIMLFNITIAAQIVAGGTAGISYLIIGGLAFFFPCAIVTTQLAAMFPHEGALYNWTHKALGGYWSFFSGFCAWLSGALIITAGPNLMVAYIQAMNPHWLSEPWQQGVAMIAFLIFGSFLARQRFRMVQYIVNGMTAIYLLSIPLIGISLVVWFLKGHPSATNFGNLSDWAVSPANFVLFGSATFAYLSTEVPLILGGEMKRERKVISFHLFWGTLVVFVSYLIAAFAMLIIEGPNSANLGLFTPVAAVEAVFGKFVGNIEAIFIMCYFFIIPTTFNYIFSRLLFAGAVDQHLPIGLGKLNKNRVPARAINFQTILAVAFVALAFIVLPYATRISRPADFALEAYNVVTAAATLIWAISVSFMFIDVVFCYIRDKQGFQKVRLFPMPLLWISCLLGTLSCGAGIVTTLGYSWTPLISNGQWWYIVGGLTIICLIIAAVGGMLANSEARWEGDKREIGFDS